MFLKIGRALSRKVAWEFERPGLVDVGLVHGFPPRVLTEPGSGMILSIAAVLITTPLLENHVRGITGVRSHPILAYLTASDTGAGHQCA